MPSEPRADNEFGPDARDMERVAAWTNTSPYMLGLMIKDPFEWTVIVHALPTVAREGEHVTYLGDCWTYWDGCWVKGRI